MRRRWPATLLAAIALGFGADAAACTCMTVVGVDEGIAAAIEVRDADLIFTGEVIGIEGRSDDVAVFAIETVWKGLAATPFRMRFARRGCAGTRFTVGSRVHLAVHISPWQDIPRGREREYTVSSCSRDNFDAVEKEALVALASYRDAAEPHRRRVQANPDDLAAWRALAQVQRLLNDRVALLETYENILRLDPGDAETRKLRSELRIPDLRPR